MSAAAEATRGHKREAGRLRRSKHNKANRWAITPNFYFQAITDDEELRGLRPHPEPSRGGVNASRRQENVLVSCSSPGVVLDFIRTRSTRRTRGSAPTCFSQYSREPSGFQGQPKPAQSLRLRFVHVASVEGEAEDGVCWRAGGEGKVKTLSPHRGKAKGNKRRHDENENSTDSAMREPTTPSCTLQGLLFFFFNQVNICRFIV